MGFRNLGQFIQNCYEEGRVNEFAFRKVPAIASAAGIWGDLSMAPGNPRPNYYVGTELSATTLNGSYGLYHGGNVSPSTCHLHKILIGSVSAGLAPAQFILCDYLLFYPLVDMDSTDEQFLDNTVTLPRYTDGVGVQAFLVATNPFIGAAQFYINYTDTDNVSKQSPLHTTNNSTFIGAFQNCANPTQAGGNGAFIKLEQGSRGIKRIDSVTFLSPNGGLGALVLVKPLATVNLNEITAFAEYDFLLMKPSLPRIYDGAYLNFICASGASYASAPVTGIITTVWSE